MCVCVCVCVCVCIALTAGSFLILLEPPVPTIHRSEQAFFCVRAELL